MATTQLSQQQLFTVDQWMAKPFQELSNSKGRRILWRILYIAITQLDRDSGLNARRRDPLQLLTRGTGQISHYYILVVALYNTVQVKFIYVQGQMS
jgi:hypothetical protein